MSMRAKLRKNEIKPFVRRVLGCGCPDEVFKHIETADLQLGRLTYQRLGIGNWRGQSA
ncbi:hypothetical protein [Solemya velesiana gill symbiont]|uniref:hypothetical protein n=1 Tax=Solemya velesiana gill symbiont TaxID=1918948 RepID=UPI00155F630F|nr:hypothetical protein [Solemya velesiana gill symbiont]